MKKGYLYTIVFMLVLSLVLVSALALADAGFGPIIAGNLVIAEKRAILEALDLEYGGSAGQVEAVFAKNIRAIRNAAGDTIHILVDDNGQTAGLVFPFSGAGLWGKIRGFVAMNPELDTLLGLVFIEQNETPGLGGRIDEARFRDQFRGLVLAEGVPLSYSAPEYDQIDAIAGATSSSRAVLTILNDFLTNQLPGLTDGLEAIP